MSHRLHLAAALALGAFVAPLASAAEDAGVNPYAKNYLTLELARNYPVSFSQNRFEPGSYGLAVGYRHDLDANWLMGVGAQFKMLKRKASAEENDSAPTDRLALWTLSHETLYSIRLDHPTYLLIGPKLHYFLPANASKFPLQRADEFETEIGAALSMVLAHLVEDRYMLTARIDRWRGTRTMRFHGLEVAAGVAFVLD